jgi:hypothetical protein
VKRHVLCVLMGYEQSKDEIKSRPYLAVDEH